MGLMIVYLTGLLLGIGFYALTFYFSKEMDGFKRVAFLVVVSLTTVVGGLLIGGFAGMPVSLIGAGILSVAFLLWIGERGPLWKKAMLTLTVLGALGGLSYIGFNQLNGSSFNVAAKDDRWDPDINKYYEQLQADPNIKGWKVFDTYEDSKAIVLSLGGEMSGNNIEVLGIEKKSGRTDINIRTFANQSKEANPTIIILLDKLEPFVQIKDTDGTVYEEIE
ncbi:hypothetical protein [Siminovitchia fordii]|uniref:hypothetical protein n=1 Tax=Siminovitchia fordii TaxID=254759 RepID=UPI000373476F|nr:hypothetical protein [Siminovitchia fordii]